MLAAVLAATAVARAGLAPAQASAVQAAFDAAFAAAPQPVRVSTHESDVGGLASSLEKTFGHPATTERVGTRCPVISLERASQGGEPEQAEVQQLPPTPSSSNLLLSGLLSLGAIGMARSAKHVHIGALPAWYHDACPERIGHTVAFDFEFTDLPVCFTADVAAADAANHPPGIHEYLRESRSRIEHQFILPRHRSAGAPGHRLSPILSARRGIFAWAFSGE